MKRPEKKLLVGGVLAPLLGAAVVAASGPVEPRALATGDPVIAAAGDIACDPAHANFHGGAGSSHACRQRYVSDPLVGAALSAALPLGDNQCTCAGLSGFQGSYDPSCGR